MYKHKQIVFMTADIIAVIASFVASFFIVYGTPQASLILGYTWLLVCIAGITLVIFYLMDLYFFRRDFTSLVDLLSLLMSLGIIFVAESALIYISGAKSFIWREFLLFDTLIKAGLIFFCKILLSVLFKNVRMRRRAIIIGTDKKARWGIDFIRRNKDIDIEVVGLIKEEDIEEDIEEEIESVKVMKHGGNLLKVVERLNANLIILAAEADKISTLQESLILCHQKQIPLIPVEKLYENVTNKVPFENIDSLQLFN